MKNLKFICFQFPIFLQKYFLSFKTLKIQHTLLMPCLFSLVFPPKRNILTLPQSVQFGSVTQSRPTIATPWIAARQASLSITNSRSSLKLTSMIGGQIYYIHNRNEIITKIKLNILWFAKKKETISVFLIDS